MSGVGASPGNPARRSSSASRESKASGSKQGYGSSSNAGKQGWDSGTNFRMGRSAFLGGKLRMLYRIYGDATASNETFQDVPRGLGGPIRPGQEADDSDEEATTSGDGIGPKPPLWCAAIEAEISASATDAGLL